MALFPGALTEAIERSTRRRKCIIPRKGSPCQFCVSRSLYCDVAAEDGVNHQYPLVRVTSNALGSSPEAHTNERSGGGLNIVDEALCNELVDLYFDLIHDKQHILFHRPTFIADQRKGQAPMILVYAIMALAARFSSSPCFQGIDPWARGRPWAEQCRVMFNDRKDTVSLLALQSCLLLHILAFIEGDMESQSLYSALAIRMAQLLDLPRKLSSDRVQRETEIRIWWTSWSMDNWSAAASSIPRQLVAELDFPRPMEEIEFEQLIPGLQYSERLPPLEDQQLYQSLGMWTHMIPLTQLITQIDELHEMTVRNSKPQLEIYQTVQKIASSLDSWLLRLPEQLRYTPGNLERYSKLGHARTLIALHLGFHHHGQLLYYQFLHYNSDTSAAPQTELAYTYANRCKEHAAGITNLLWHAYSTPGHECVWVVNGHLLAISSSVHLHTLLFGKRNVEIDAAKNMLKQNFEMIMDMRRYWPSLDLSMSRLRTFHRECQNSMDTSFAMDQWMLNFLQRYTKPVNDEKIVLPRLPGEALSPDMPEWQRDICDTSSNHGL